jgi:glycosyltransferase involved in cell wall biosynthesis
MRAAPLRLGYDYRAALHNREGIGRAQRLALAALRRHAAEAGQPLELALFAATLRRPQVPAEERANPADVQRWFGPRLPARLAWPLTRSLGGAARWLGGLDLFLGLATQPLWVGPARSVALLYDLLFLEGRGVFLSAPAADRMARALERWLPQIARLQVPSRHVARAAAEQLGLPAERIDVVPLGGDGLAAVPEQAIELPPGPFVLTVGRVDPRKNLIGGLRAFERAAAQRADLHWLLVGPAGFASEGILTALQDSRHAGRIRWLGQQPDGVLRFLYARCTAFLFPSLAEGFGLPPLEARYFGAPVVSSNQSSLPEFLDDGGTLFAHPEDELGLAEALAESLARPRSSLPPFGGPTFADGARAQWASLRRALDCEHR